MELKLEELCFTVLPDLRPLGTFMGFKDTRLEVQRTLTLLNLLGPLGDGNLTCASGDGNLTSDSIFCYPN